MKLISLFFALWFSILPGFCQDVRVIDGDTIVLDGERIRLICIDAPELKQPYGKEAKEVLENLLKRNEISFYGTKRDKYGRLLAEVWTRNDLVATCVNKSMVMLGMAHTYMCKEGDYIRAEQFAKDNKIGLWSQSNPQLPSDYRKERRELYGEDNETY